METTTKTKRTATAMEQKVFKYLNDLRRSGETNMFGAGSYISSRFGTDKITSRKYLSLWMHNFNDEGNYSEIEE